MVVVTAEVRPSLDNILEDGRAALAEWAEETLVTEARERRAARRGVRARWARRLTDASNELFFALDAFAKLPEYYGEVALDELINCAFNPRCPAPRRPDVDPDVLKAARARLATAGMQWAKAVVRSAQAVESAAAYDGASRK